MLITNRGTSRTLLLVTAACLESCFLPQASWAVEESELLSLFPAQPFSLVIAHLSKAD